MIQSLIFTPPDGASYMQDVEITAAGASIVSEPRPLDSGAVPPPPSGVPNRSLKSKAVSLTKALALTAARGPVDEPTRLARRAACTGLVTLSIDGEPVGVQLPRCEHFKPLEDQDDDGHCQACGCGEWKLSLMSKKWRMRGAGCPIGRFPESVIPSVVEQ